MMKALYAPMLELEQFRRLRDDLKKTAGMHLVSGCIDSQKTHLIACLSQDYPVSMIIASNDLRAREIYENYQLFSSRVLLYPARDVLFFQADVQSMQLTTERVRVMKALASSSSEDSGENGLTVIVTLPALMSHCMPAERWVDAIRSFSEGDEISLTEEQQELSRIGYEKCEEVQQPGQYAVRGGILDIYPLTEENPVRIELWGDEIDSIRSFDAQSQRTIDNIASVYVYPAAEFVTTDEITREGLLRLSKETARVSKKFRDRHMSEEAFRVSEILNVAKERLEDFGDTTVMEGFCDYFYPDAVSLLDYFPANTPIFIDEPAKAEESAKETEAEFQDSITHRMEKGYAVPGQADILFAPKQIISRLSERHLCGLSITTGGKNGFPDGEKYDISAAGTGSYNSDFSMLIKDLEHYRKNRWRVVLLSASRTRGKRLAQDITGRNIPAFYSEDADRELKGGEIMITAGASHRGYEYPMLKFAVLSESDIFGTQNRKPARKKKYQGKTIASFTDLHSGDYVVHENHGIGVYRGVEKVTVDGVQKDYMKIEYAGGSNLYVLATQLDMIQKYADADSKAPKISKLGGTEWTRTKGRVKAAVEEVAQELVDLYAVRQNQKGHSFPPDNEWQHEFEELFPFEETQDQLQAIEDTKKDMESDKIMDRLVCGDVGYGKTEIAIRAAFKAVQDGKQVAYLVPTTILAQQHYNTFTQRMKDYPVNVGLLCRFRSKSEQAQTIRDLKEGVCDIVIGTHRLLSKDVQFHSLGLLVIDEEQRFGVTHKEKIKEMKKNVDVLTLTATPIPRTLHMSLVGIRDMSVLEEAPQDRLPVQTFVMEYSEETIREAIAREMARGGQVYLVYNHVSTISDMAKRVQDMVPSARVSYAHGRMNAEQIEDIMYDFVNGDVDVLVTTTIIETGLDIANVNTIIICDADRMGLSQLYQLRGRVGRSNRTAYAFLMYRRNKLLKETAEKRLSAIREYTELGSGFRIAMRDLEIRGAGNMLGKAQSGHMAEVGYDLYCKLLNESVMALKGENIESTEFDTSIDLDVDAFIPPTYVPNEVQKLNLYKRIASISTQDEYEDMLDELMDRFGEPPKSVQSLLVIALLKARAHALGITELTQKDDEIHLIFYEKAKISPDKVSDFLKNSRGRFRFVVGKKPYFSCQLAKKNGKREDVLQAAGRMLTEVKDGMLDMTL